MSDARGSRAISAVHRGDVVELPDARTFGVRGSDGEQVYLVTLAVLPGAVMATSCTCEAFRHRRPCWHTRAGELMARAQREGVPVPPAA